MDRNRQNKMRTKKEKDRRENKDKKSMPKNVVETPSKRNENLKNPKTTKKNFPKSISSEKLPMQMRKNDMNERMPESEYKPRMPNKNKIRDNVNSSFDNNGSSYKRNSISKKMNEKMNKENNHNDKIAPYNLDNKFERNKTNMNDINNNRRGDRNNNNNNVINNTNKNDKGKNISNFSLINTINEINNKSQNKNIEILNKNNLFFSPSHQNNYNNDESQKKFRSASVEKPNVTYSNFINNLKKQMKTNQDTGNLETKFKNKKKKNVFGDFLNQFVNKEKEMAERPMNAFNNNMNNIPNITNKNNVNINANNNIQINTNNNTNNNTSNNTNHNTNKNPNKVRKFRNIHKNRITNFCIPASGIRNFNNYNNIGNNSELLSMKRELEMRDSKIKELVSIIEKWNSAYNLVVQENQKLKEEINILKNGSNNYNQNNNSNINNNNDINKYNINNQNSNFDSNLSKKNEKAQINNLITYNINKNNNYNIINSEINNFNNFVQNQNINNIKSIEDNKRDPLKEKGNDQDRKARKDRKASIAFERFKKMNRTNSAEKEIQKSDKISGMAKMLENHIGGPRRENSVDVCERIEDIRNNINNDFNNDVVNIIDSQPVVNKKKKKMRSFSYDD